MAIICTVDDTGIHKPTYDEVLSALQDAFRGIYGADIYIEPDSQDGQFLAIMALALNDANNMAVAVYNSFSPSTAQGVGLSTVVKLNGIARKVASNSTVDLTLIGQGGTTILNGIVSGNSGAQWALPASVILPAEGEITVTATAVDIGAVAGPAGTIVNIATPTRGWQSVTNAADATIGAPVESDAVLRQRQTASTALPSRTVFEGTLGGIASLTGVTAYRGYENDTDTADANGIPAHSIAVVVDGGNASDIATQIAQRKTPGTGTYGTTTEVVEDQYGIRRNINFFRPTDVTVQVNIVMTAQIGFSSSVQDAVQQAVVDFINGVGIGNNVEWAEVFVPANLGLVSGARTFKIASLAIARGVGAFGTSDVTIAFNERPIAQPSDVIITVT